MEKLLKDVVFLSYQHEIDAQKLGTNNRKHYIHIRVFCEKRDQKQKINCANMVDSTMPEKVVDKII